MRRYTLHRGRAPRGDPGTRRQQAPGRRDEPAERVVVEVGDPRERVDPLGEQRLVAPDVADAGERPLVEQRGADREVAAFRGAESADGLRSVEVGRQEVRAEAAQGRVERFGPLLEELDDRGVEAHRDGARAPRARGVPATAAGASAPRAGSDATSRSSGGGCAARDRRRSGSGGSCRAPRQIGSPCRRPARSAGRRPGRRSGRRSPSVRRDTAAGRRRSGGACRPRARSGQRRVSVAGAADARSVRPR